MGQQEVSVDAQWGSYLAQWEDDFSEKNQYGLSFEAECHFAKQVILSNKGVLAASRNNPSSLHNAIMNSSAIGISLNPALKHAYLVPRDGSVCLDISYLGLIKLACDSGSIITAKAELVHGPRGEYKGDRYEWKGPFIPPLHEAESFHPDRINGDDPLDGILGGYCVAVLPSNTVVVEQMSAAEIYAVRSTSKAFTSGKPCPWVGKWSGQMGKKTLLKRSSNGWPQGVAGRDRLDNAIHILNQHEGLRESEIYGAGENTAEEANSAPLCISHEQSSSLQSAIKVAGMTNQQFCTMAGISDIGDLENHRLEPALARLKQIAQRGGQQ
jgi:recombination protein RecT